MTAAREGWPGRRLVVVFQPHRYSRTRDLFDDFSQVLATADAVVLTDVYAAGEAPSTASTAAPCASPSGPGDGSIRCSFPTLTTFPRELPSMLEDDDLVLLAGGRKHRPDCAGDSRKRLSAEEAWLSQAATTQNPRPAAFRPGRAGHWWRQRRARGVAERRPGRGRGAWRATASTHQVFDGPLALFEAIGRGEMDRVFNLLHGPGGEDGSLQGALQLMNIPVTGADLAASALTMDKVRSKWVWERNGIDTPPFECFGPDDHDYHGRWTGSACRCSSSPPGWVPASASPGSVAEDLDRRRGPGAAVWRLDHHRGRNRGGEYFAGVLGRLSLPLIRVETPREFYDYEAKYESDETRYLLPLRSARGAGGGSCVHRP